VRLCGAGAFDDEVAAWERSLAGRIQGFVGGSFVEIDRYAIARPPLRRGRAGYSMGLILGACTRCGTLNHVKATSLERSPVSDLDAAFAAISNQSTQ